MPHPGGVTNVAEDVHNLRTILANISEKYVKIPLQLFKAMTKARWNTSSKGTCSGLATKSSTSIGTMKQQCSNTVGNGKSQEYSCVDRYSACVK